MPELVVSMRERDLINEVYVDLLLPGLLRLSEYDDSDPYVVELAVRDGGRGCVR